MKNKPYDTIFIDKAAEEIKERALLPFVGICTTCGYDHGSADFQFQRLRKAVSEFARTRCTCGVSTTLGVVHRADAPCFHFTGDENADKRVIDGLRAEIEALVNQLEEARGIKA